MLVVAGELPVGSPPSLLLSLVRGPLSAIRVKYGCRDVGNSSPWPQGISFWASNPPGASFQHPGLLSTAAAQTSGTCKVGSTG